MTVKVIGAGFGRTGTLSLKFALEKLGFDKCYHMMEVGFNPSHRQQWMDLADGKDVDWHALMTGYQATVDWPSANFWQQQMQAFPEAKVLLSLRDPDKWYDSVMNTIWDVSSAGLESDDPERRLGAEMAFKVIWDPVFGRRMDDRAHVIEVFNTHNQNVIDNVPAEDLLVYQPGDGWAPICEFLDVPIPDEDYPKVNTTEEFTSRWADIAEQAKDKNN